MHLWLKCFIVMVFFAENILDRVVGTGKPGSQTSDAMCANGRLSLLVNVRIVMISITDERSQSLKTSNK